MSVGWKHSLACAIHDGAPCSCKEDSAIRPEDDALDRLEWAAKKVPELSAPDLAAMVRRAYPRMAQREGLAALDELVRRADRYQSADFPHNKVKPPRDGARALLSASPGAEGYRERPIEEDFYLDPKGEWVYRWNDERWVLRSPPDKSADFDNCPDEDWGETDGGGAK